MQRTPLLNFSQCPKDTHETRKPHFPQRRRQKKSFFEIHSNCFQKSHSAEKELSARKTTFSQAKISYESGRVPFESFEKKPRSQKSLINSHKTEKPEELQMILYQF